MPRAADISWYFVHCFSASGTLARVQPRIASLDLGMSTFCSSRSWAFASMGGSALAQGQHHSQLLLPDLDITITIWGEKKRVRNLWIVNSWDDTQRWARGKMVTLHGSLGWRKQRVNVQQQCWRKAGIWAVLALTCWDLRLGSKV